MSRLGSERSTLAARKVPRTRSAPSLRVDDSERPKSCRRADGRLSPIEIELGEVFSQLEQLVAGVEVVILRKLEQFGTPSVGVEQYSPELTQSRRHDRDGIRVDLKDERDEGRIDLDDLAEWLPGDRIDPSRDLH